MTPIPDKSLSYREKRTIGRIKLWLFAATMILIIHALPGKWIREAFPITRWHMFSAAEPFPIQGLRTIQYRVIDARGMTYTLEGAELYNKTGVGGFEAIAFTLGEFAALDEKADVRQEHRRVIALRMNELLQIPIARIEIWEVIYRVNFDNLPHVDYQNPAQRTLLADFAPEDVL